MMYKKMICLGVLAGAITHFAYAQETSVTASAIITKPTQANTIEKKTVYLLPVHLTEKQKAQLNAPEIMEAITSKNVLPSKFDQGMNGVPVLDQGAHGTCVTFANTAAVDALLGQGDYVSQLCNLELGSYIQNNGYVPSGWDGSWGADVLDQMAEFGVIPKAAQESQSCEGVKEYPINQPNNEGVPMPLSDYKQMSRPLMSLTQGTYFIWEPILTSFDRFTEWKFSPRKVMEDIKVALVSEHLAAASVKVTFGVLLPVQYCSVGACGTYHQTDDSWVATKEIMSDKHPVVGGHEMVITGYDDNAVAIDNDGVAHQGLFILRNSWGTNVGDGGTYYMSYDFFRHFVLEAQKLVFSKSFN